MTTVTQQTHKTSLTLSHDDRQRTVHARITSPKVTVHNHSNTTSCHDRQVSVLKLHIERKTKLRYKAATFISLSHSLSIVLHLLSFAFSWPAFIFVVMHLQNRQTSHAALIQRPYRTTVTATIGHFQVQHAVVTLPK
jgi:hypothetical protein